MCVSEALDAYFGVRAPLLPAPLASQDEVWKVPESIKCGCAHCGAKYRLPTEAQGRFVRCKQCGEKFRVPAVAANGAKSSLEDSVLSWLEDEAAAPEAPTTTGPRVIQMPTDDGASSDSGIGIGPAKKSERSTTSTH